jgi:hypothetical protein
MSLITPDPLPLNEPINVTITVTPSANYSTANPYATARIYLDGELIISQVGKFVIPYDRGIQFFYIGGAHAQECEFFLAEVYNQPLTQWEAAKNYNKYASRFNKPEVYIPYPQWTDQGLLFTSGTWVDLIDYNNNTYPQSAGQYGIASFGIVNLNGSWYSNPGETIFDRGNMLKVVAGRTPGSYAAPAYGYVGDEAGLHISTPFGAGTLGLGDLYSDFNGKYPGEWIRTYTDLGVFCPGHLRSYYDNNPFFCFYTPASSLSACKYYINNTITQTIYPIGAVQPQDTYGYPQPSNLTLVAGIILSPQYVQYTNSNNTIFMSGLLSLTAVSDFQVNRLYDLTKRTIGSSLGLP